MAQIASGQPVLFILVFILFNLYICFNERKLSRHLCSQKRSKGNWKFDDLKLAGHSLPGHQVLIGRLAGSR